VAWVNVGDEPRPANMVFPISVGFVSLFVQKAPEADFDDYDLWIWLGFAYEAQETPVEAAGAYRSAVKAGYGFHHGCRRPPPPFEK